MLSSSSCHKATSCSKGCQGSCAHHSAIREDLLTCHYTGGKSSSYTYSQYQMNELCFICSWLCIPFLLVHKCGDPRCHPDQRRRWHWRMWVSCRLVGWFLLIEALSRGNRKEKKWHSSCLRSLYSFARKSETNYLLYVSANVLYLKGQIIKFAIPEI